MKKPHLFPSRYPRSLTLLLVLFTVILPARANEHHNLTHGNAAIEVVIPFAIPAIFEASPTAGDATLVLRATTLITNSWFDAVAPYHPTAVGVYSNLGRRPANESENNLNLNIALLYASYHALNSLFPHRNDDWRAMLASAGLDPDNNTTALTEPAGIGNAAGIALVAARENDGMNQLGNEGDRTYHRAPYADYTGYAPVNTAYELSDPSRWQPAMTGSNGLFKIQQFVTPQMRITRPYSYHNPKRFRARPPVKSNVRNYGAYRQQADEVLQASASMTDEQKAMAELFDNKINSLGFSAVFASFSQQLSLAEFIQYDFLTNMAAFDTAIAIWQEKARFDAVRPFSAIRYLYGDELVTAWGGPGQGTVYDLKGSEWTSYLPVADHPEYPSGSASFCAAHAEASRLFLGSDQLGYVVSVPQGSSRIEPGVTPAADIELVFPTWSDFEHNCSMSRFWSGVHFLSSLPEGEKIGNRVARYAYNFMVAKLNGD
ncbi:MAG: vanadium-dependent haloperoxidase [Marinobacter sp.]|uniref:vanadium-dependent haloperoxidase n=1 Tax=Marinobacter sp. TaxID=50741 RepID=UPI003297E8B3